MGELVGEGYGDDKDETAEESGDPVEERARIREHQGPGEGPLDKPATTGTHRGWGDPQAEETK
jgi:hypothetical protein